MIDLLNARDHEAVAQVLSYVHANLYDLHAIRVADTPHYRVSIHNNVREIARGDGTSLMAAFRLLSTEIP